MSLDYNIPQTDARQTKTECFSFVIAANVAFLLCLFFVGSVFFKTPASAPITIDSKINPNTASAASLVRLPSIGYAMAEAIIEYRNTYSGENKPFQMPADLIKVHGIGPKKAEAIAAYLRFE